MSTETNEIDLSAFDSKINEETELTVEELKKRLKEMKIAIQEAQIECKKKISEDKEQHEKRMKTEKQASREVFQENTKLRRELKDLEDFRETREQAFLLFKNRVASSRRRI